MPVQPPTKHPVRGYLLKLSIVPILGSTRFWWVISLCSGAILAWASRFGMNGDGLSYLDIASNAARNGPSHLINDFWSPGYPALLSIALYLFHPSPAHEFPIVHLVNFLIYVLALWGFSIFLKYWLRLQDREQDSAKGRNWLVAFSFSIFLGITTRFIGIGLVTPDLCLAAVVFLAAGIACRLALPEPGWKHYGALGLVLGAGYYIKAALLPLGIALLVLLFFLLPPEEGANRRRRFLSLGSSFLVTTLLATPLVAVLSAQAGHFSTGEVARLNYLWWVNGVPDDFAAWNNGISAVYPSLEHPPRVLAQKPLVFGFGFPVEGTYPLWYDPAYWFAGAKIKIDLVQQIVRTGEVLKGYGAIMKPMAPLVGGAIVLFAFGFRRQRASSSRRSAWWLVAWSLSACSMYALLVVEWRYVGAFVALFWLESYRVLMSRVEKRTASAVCATVIVIVMIPFAAVVAQRSIGSMAGLIHPRLSDYEIVALDLRDLGLHKGDRVAIVGTSFNYYYARYDRLRIVAEIPDAHAFWQISEPRLRSLEELLASKRVKALVAPNRPDDVAPADWKDKQISGTQRLSVLLLPAAQQR